MQDPRTIFQQILQQQQQLAQTQHVSKDAPLHVALSAKKDKKVAAIYLLDAVDKWLGVSAQTIRTAMAGVEDADQIDVYINSPGGQVQEGFTMMDLLKAYKGKVNTYIYGMAASMAAIISQVAKEKGGKRYISNTGSMMVHSARGILFGNKQQMEDGMKMLEITNRNLENKLVATTGQPRETVQDWMSRDTWFSAAEAVELGLADEFIEPDLQAVALFGAAPTPPAHTPPAEASTPQHPTDTTTTMKQLLAHFALEATLSEEGIITALQTRMDQLQAAATAATAATTKAADSLKAFAEANKLVAEAQKPAFEALLKAGDLTAASSLLTIPVIKETAVLQPGADAATTGIPTGTEHEKTKAEKDAARLAEAEAMGFKSLEAVGKLPQPK